MKTSTTTLLIAVFLLTLMLTPAAAFGLDVGDSAPQFSGDSTQGTIQLTNILGKKNVVLAFYSAVNKSYWTDELLNFQRDLEAFEKLDAQIIGVSPDSMETIRKFAAENGIDFPLVSDQGNAIRRKFGRGLVTYLIDKSGVIRFVQKGVPDNDNFLNALKKLR